MPLLALGLTEPRLFVAGVTGSTGSGRKPTEGTHHPLRHSDLYSYGALGHRHAPEIAACAKRRRGIDAEINFVPHSGPFARGIHVTVQAALEEAAWTARPRSRRSPSYYRGLPLRARGRQRRRASRTWPRATTRIFTPSTNGGTIAVMAVLDNLNKGAAGGGVQWMNRLLGFDESAGTHGARSGMDLNDA